MKVLYVGHFDGTGYSVAATDYVLAMDSVGIDVVPRPFLLGDAKPTFPARLRALMEKPAGGCDVVIQHTLPQYTVYDGHFKKNICLFASETTDFRTSTWADRLNLMDEVWVINDQSAAACRASGVTRPIQVVPHACDVTRFQRSYTPLPGLRDGLETVFYGVGEFVRRKNWGAFIKAFHLEFDPYEPVGLVLKTSIPGMSPERARGQVEKFIFEIKRGLKLHGGHPELYRPEVIITERLSDEDMLRLHATGDCYVSTSFAEAWNLSLTDSMGMGRPGIITAAGGHLQHATDRTSWLVQCRLEPAFGANDTMGDLYVGSENWYAVDLLHLRRCLREAHENKGLREKKSLAGVESVYLQSYEEVGNHIKRLLDATPALAGPAK